jgi:glycosyltransferase involved in cell wall biosynthesis
MSCKLSVIVTAHNEGDRIGATLRALSGTFPGARVLVVDDGSRDDTSKRARDGGAQVVRSERTLGKGRAATLAAEKALADFRPEEETVVLLCDGDLGDSAAQLGPLVEAVKAGEGEIAVASFARRVGGGFGLVLGYARRANHRRCGLDLQAPLSGQRAMRMGTLEQLLPFAPGYGMEVGMAFDAARRGWRIVELRLDLRHRATRRDVSGFLHRGRQLLDVVRAVHRCGHAGRGDKTLGGARRQDAGRGAATRRRAGRG